MKRVDLNHTHMALHEIKIPHKQWGHGPVAVQENRGVTVNMSSYTEIAVKGSQVVVTLGFNTST